MKMLRVTITRAAQEILAAWAAENNIVISAGEEPLNGKVTIELDEEVFHALERLDSDISKAIIRAIEGGEQP